LPLELLRSLDIDGHLRIGRVKVMNLTTEAIDTTLKAEDGNFRLHPLSAKLYQGGYRGDLRLNVQGDTPKLAMNESLSGVQAGPLLKDFLGKDYVTGKANVAAKLTAEGIEPTAIRKSLNGSGNFSFVNGQIKGLNIGQRIREAYALYQRQPKPTEETKQTDFSRLSGSFTVTNGLVKTRDLSARSPLFQVEGKGSADLVRERLDMRLDTTVVSDIRDATGERSGELTGEVIPITIKGRFDDPAIGVDVASVLKAKAKAALDAKKREAQQKLEQKKREAQQQLEQKKREAEARARERVEEEKKKLQQDLEDKFKDMLKF
jgi:AsmA protein